MAALFQHYAPYADAGIGFTENLYQPSTFKSFNNQTFMFWERALFQRAASSIEFDLPKEWSGAVKDFYVYCVFRFGFVAVFKKAEYGIMFQPCTLSGYNVYYQPTRVLISNPAFVGGLDMQIGAECELLKLTPDYMGIWDVVAYYAEKLALLSASFDMSAINSRIAYVIGAKNKSAAEALKVIVDKVNAGQTTVVYDKSIESNAGDTEPFAIFDRRNVKDGYLCEEILREMRTVINDFDKEIGIPTLPMEKKERMITDEARSSIIDGTARSIIWEECFNSSAELVNKMFGTNIKCKRRYDELLAKLMEGEDKEDAGKTDAERNDDV